MTKKADKKSKEKTKPRKLKLHKETMKDLDSNEPSVKGGQAPRLRGTEQYTCPLTCK